MWEPMRARRTFFCGLHFAGSPVFLPKVNVLDLDRVSPLRACGCVRWFPPVVCVVLCVLESPCEDCVPRSPQSRLCPCITSNTVAVFRALAPIHA